jgi:PadR family transcriptional regulator PadR
LTDIVLGLILFFGGDEMGASEITSDLLRGNTDTMILRILAESDCYGYEIVKLIAERSNGEYELKEATMYSSVRRLEADGDITWYWGDESQGGRRKYFRITEKGRMTYARNKSNWEYAKRVLDTLL